MKLTDSIAQLILQMLDETDGRIEIKRNEMANRLGCVPSQINYVITSRFTPEQGFVVESRRGGGGYIKITRVICADTAIMHIVNSIGFSITESEARAMLGNLLYEKLIDKKSASLMCCATSDNSLREIEAPTRDSVRATLMKQLLLTSCV